MASRPTIIDVAKYAGVSKTTVSRVINNKTSKVSEETLLKVRNAIDVLGYQYNAIASSMRTNRTNFVMLMIPDITNPFWPEVARGIQDTMEKASYSVVFANIDWNKYREQEFLDIAMRTRADGILINPLCVSEEKITASKIPTVILGIRPGFPNLDMVGSDSYQATIMALEYLYELGHRKIGFLMGKSEVASSSSRLQSYQEFCIQRNLPINQDNVVEVTFDSKGGMLGMEQFLNHQEIPTAILASNDLIALGAMQVATENGYDVPRDISIIGIDDIHAASLTNPPLTTVRKMKYDIGCKAAEILLSKLSEDKSSPPQVIKIPCQLIIRGSTQERF